MTEPESRPVAAVSPASLLAADGTTHSLGATCSIGRHASNTISIQGAKVSRQHCHVYAVGNQYQLVDNRSTNGTYVNGRRITTPVSLRNGDRIDVGEHHFQFRQIDGTPETVDDLETSFGNTMEAIRREACWFLVADVMNSTQLAQDLGEETFSRAMSQWFRECRVIIEARAGEINKATGDGLFAVWRGDDPALPGQVESALRAIEDMRRRSAFAFRFVAHYGMAAIGGSATLGEEALAGPEVHFVFRSEKLADALGQTFLVSRPAVEELGWLTTALSLGRHPLKGFNGDFEFYTHPLS
jgi:pSer/pThr/pTyr-binding forkhead associated (FHA) protein